MIAPRMRLLRLHHFFSSEADIAWMKAKGDQASPPPTIKEDGLDEICAEFRVAKPVIGYPCAMPTVQPCPDSRGSHEG